MQLNSIFYPYRYNLSCHGVLPSSVRRMIQFQLLISAYIGKFKFMCFDIYVLIFSSVECDRAHTPHLLNTIYIKKHVLLKLCNFFQSYTLRLLLTLICKCRLRTPLSLTKMTHLTSIYKFGLSVCLFVCLYLINVKTAEPIEPKFCVGHHVTLGKVYEWKYF